MSTTSNDLPRITTERPPEPLPACGVKGCPDHPVAPSADPFDLSDLPPLTRALVQGVVDGIRAVPAADRSGPDAFAAAVATVERMGKCPAGRAALARLGGPRRLGARLMRQRTCSAFLRWSPRVLG